MNKYIPFTVVLFLVLASFYKLNYFELNQDDTILSSNNYELTNPKWSPNGKYILATSEKQEGLYILNASDLSINKILLKEKRIGYGATWSSDSKEVYFRLKSNYKFHTFKVNLETGKSEWVDINPQYLTCKGFFPENTNKVYLNNENKVVKEDKNKEITYITPQNEINYYHIVNKPNSTNIIYHKASEAILYNTKTKKEQIIGVGIANTITSDGNYILYHLDYSDDGHYLKGSELYVFDVKKGTSKKITNTKDIAEMWPDISPDGKKVVYSDELTGKIVISNIKY